jgi:teichuronic acid biosynthesis glycosyltransferase TuaG
MVVSVIMPTYNRASKICRAIESVVNQIYRDWELIIVDDCSSDNTKAVIAKYLVDQRISYFMNERNLGASYSRNFGLLNSTGKYIVFLDSDDELDDNKLALQVNEMKHRGCDVIFSGTRFRGGLIEFDNTTRVGFSWTDFLYKRIVIHIESPLWSKSFLESVGLFNHEVKCGQDWEYYLRCLLKRPKAYSLKWILSTAYEDINGRISNNRNLAYYMDLLMSRYFVYRDHLPKEYNQIFENYIKYFIAEYSCKLLGIDCRDSWFFTIRAMRMFGFPNYFIPSIYFTVFKIVLERGVRYIKRAKALRSVLCLR